MFLDEYACMSSQMAVNNWLLLLNSLNVLKNLFFVKDC